MRYNHRLKILKGYNLDTLERQYREYLNSIQDRYGGNFNVSQWIELFDSGKSVPNIHMFIFIEDYMDDEEYNKKFPPVI